MRTAVVTAFFPRTRDVAEAVERLVQHVPVGAVSILAGSSAATGTFAPRTLHARDLGLRGTTKWAQGATLGGLLGAAAGALVGGFSAAASCIVPALGLVMAGPMLAALAGAGALGPVGALAGALVGAAIPAYEAARIDDARRPGALIAVRCETHRAAFITDLLATAGGRWVRAETD